MLPRILLLLALGLTIELSAQELQSRVSIIANKVSSQVDRKIFQTLQGGLTNFINTRKWTNDAFGPAEKVQCSFLISIDQDLGNNVFKGKLTVQAARPVYNTSYESPLINFQDDNVVFKYVEFQPIEFNENRVQGNDPLVANLTAIIAFYINIILGLDYDSYALRGGDLYFQRAWNIVNNAPGARDIAGWKSFDGLRNRYWLAENMNNNRFTLVHDAIYAYYRSGMDVFYENEEAGRNGMLNALNYLNTVNTENLNSMIVPFFFQGKANELVKVFGKGSNEQRTRARELLTKMDITNISLYKSL
jgi:predicted transcriptional regulator